jgi:hypothetical protein
MEIQPATSAPLRLHIREMQENFTKVPDEDGNASGLGHFFLNLGVTALAGTVYIPLSIASGKKPAGFVYQIEGTGESEIVTANVEVRDAKKTGVTEILLGTIPYVEIPMGMTATLYLSIDIKGRIGKEYAIAITRIDYKRDLSDARYQKYVEETRTNTLNFY